MKKSSRILAAAIALCMVLSLGAFASGEPGGGSDETVMSVNASAEPGGTAFEIGADGLTRNESDAVSYASGEITDTEASNVFMMIDDFSTTGFKVTDGEYTLRDCFILKAPSEKVGANDAGGTVATVTNGLLTIDGCLFINCGKGGRNGNYTVDCERTGTMVVIDSLIFQLGFDADPEGFTADIADPPSNLGLLISGYARANMSVGRSQTYYYGSTVVTEGWAAMSTDSAQSGFAFYSYDSDAVALHGGYGTYADTTCVDWFYASRLMSPEVGAIISNNGEIHMRNGADADEAALAYLPADYEFSEDYGDGRSSVIAGRNDFQLHSPDMGGGGARGDFVATLDLKDTDLATSAELDEEATLIDWSKDYGPAVAEYIDLVKGANILVKSTGADITLDNVTAESSSGVLLMTALNSDSMSRYALAADDMSDKYVRMTIRNSDISGSVCHFDYQRNTAVTLENSTWSGYYATIDKADWDSIWSDEAKAHEYCCWILDTDKYFDGEGTVSELTVGAGSVWNAWGESHLDELTVEPGGVVNGFVSVDGVEVDVSKGGHWTGEIVVLMDDGGPSPFAAASGSPEPASDEAYPHFDEYRDHVAEYALADDFMANQPGIPDDIYNAVTPYDQVFLDIVPPIGAMDYDTWLAAYNG